MLVLIFGVTFITTRSLSPYKEAEAATIELAERRADLAKADDFYWYNDVETYFTITGTDTEGTPIVVIVQQDGGAIEVFEEEEIISKQEAIQVAYDEEEPVKILEARIGIKDEEPVWEVSYRQETGHVGYVYVSLTSGEWLQTTKNI